MHASEAKEAANKFNKIDTDKLDDRVLDGIEIEIHEASSKGMYSIEYTYTGGLTYADLIYCQDKLEEDGYKVELSDEGVLSIDWSRATTLEF